VTAIIVDGRPLSQWPAPDDPEVLRLVRKAQHLKKRRDLYALRGASDRVANRELNAQSLVCLIEALIEMRPYVGTEP